MSPRLNLVLTYAYSGDLKTGISVAEGLRERFGDTIAGALPAMYALSGQPDMALRVMESLPKREDLTRRMGRAHLFAIMGRPDEARALLRDIEAGRLQEYANSSALAELYAVVGESERAISLLEQDWRSGDRTFWASYLDSGFDPIRDDPRFLAILRAMNLPTTLPRPRWTSPLGRPS